MAFEQERRDALHLLQGIENGTASATHSAHLIEQADPALVYFLLTWLRHHYAGDHPAAEGVIGRLVKLTSRHASVKAKMAEGKRDSIVAWFEDEHDYRNFGAMEFVAIIVEKLEG